MRVMTLGAVPALSPAVRPDPALTPVTERSDPWLGEGTRNNLKAVLILGSLGLGTAWLMGGTKAPFSPTGLLGGAVAVVPGAVLGAGAGALGVRLFIDDREGWGALIYGILGGIAGAGIASGATYTMIARRR